MVGNAESLALAGGLGADPRGSGRLRGKTALVTAAGQGMGRAGALAFVREGARVIATDRDPKLLEALQGIAGLTTRHLDVLDGPAVRAAVQEIGAVDILFLVVRVVLERLAENRDHHSGAGVRREMNGRTGDRLSPRRGMPRGKLSMERISLNLFFQNQQKKGANPKLGDIR